MKNLRHVGIVVSDIKKSLFFYKNLLSLKIISDNIESEDFIQDILDLKKSKLRTIKMSSDEGNSLVELLYFESHKDKKRRIIMPFSLGPTHIAFEVDNLDEEYIRLKKKGTVFISAPQYSPDGRAKVVFCKDPDGTLIELVEIFKK
jgi:catechol 2,3-dioxygenase-like lactoylglutathione lyase family enzyme